MGKVQKKSYPKFEAGTYPANGLAFFSKDNSGNPIFKSIDTRYGGMLVAQFNTYFGEDQGPPGSVSPQDLPLLAVAFGIDPAKLPDDRTKALFTLEQLIAEKPKEVDVYVGKSGWISSISGMEVPAGAYLFRRGAIVSRKDGEAVWYDGEYGEYCLLSLELVMNADGTPSLYKDTATTKVWVTRKPFIIARALAPDEMGQVFGAEENELETLMAAMEEANKSSYVYCEIVQGENRTKPDPLSLRAVPIGATVSTTQMGKDAEVLEPAHMKALYEAIAWGVKGDYPGEPAFDANGKLTATGKKWCGANLKPIAGQHHLTIKFAKMDLETVQVYLAELGSQYARFLAMTQPEPKIEEETDDFGDDGDAGEDNWD